MWENQMKFWAPGFSLAWPFMEWMDIWKISLSPPLFPHCPFKINKCLFIYTYLINLDWKYACLSTICIHVCQGTLMSGKKEHGKLPKWLPFPDLIWEDYAYTQHISQTREIKVTCIQSFIEEECFGVESNIKSSPLSFSLTYAINTYNLIF